MKTFIPALLLSILTIFPVKSQSKKELQATIDRLQEENAALSLDKVRLQNKVMDLNEKLIASQQQILQLQQAVAVKPQTSTQTTTSEQVSGGRCQATTQKGTQCSRMADAGSAYCWQHKVTYEPNSDKPKTLKSGSSTQSSGSTTSGGRTIYTGPRGGKYYINSHGNKTYIK